MKLTFTLLLIGLAGAYAQVFNQVCQPTEVVFLLDHSENARKASTMTAGNNFQLLREAWTRYMTDLDRLGSNLFRIWSWAYSSRATPLEMVTRGSTPRQAMNAPFGSLSSGGSWTYVGLEQLRNQRPSLPNNVVVIISAQGSMNDVRRNQARTLYNSLSQNGWNTYVIGVKSSDDIDTQELVIVNGNRQPVILDDNQPTNKKSYSLLYNALSAVTNQYLCNQRIITTPQPFRTTPRVTRPPSTGICSDCRTEGGFGFDTHDRYCDAFYQCLPNNEYALKHCSQSLVWNNLIGTCVTTTSFACGTGTCNGQYVGRTYASAVCCNMFFRCNGTALEYTKCPSGQVYNENSGQCSPSSNPVSECAARNSFYCNERVWNEPVDCGSFQPHPEGDPCKYIQAGNMMDTSLGTMWDQNACSLVKSDICLQRDFTSRVGDISATCSPLLLSAFEANGPDVVSLRFPDMEIYARLVGVVKTRGAIVFRPGLTAGHAYYYYFNNNYIPGGSAFRIVFQVMGQTPGVEYSLFSNNYCPDCPESIGATVRMVSGSSYVITTKFTDDANSVVVTTTTQVDQVPNGGWLSLNVVWGINDVHGVVKILSSNKQQVSTVQIPPAMHSPSSTMRANKCGILLGDGPNTLFVGSIDEFAYYSNCANIDDVLQL